MSNGDLQRAAAAQQQAAGANQLLGGLGSQAATRAPTNIEQATARVLALIERLAEQNQMLETTIDRVNGAEPRNEKDCESAGHGSGQLSELHFQIERLENMSREVGRKIEQLASTI